MSRKKYQHKAPNQKQGPWSGARFYRVPLDVQNIVVEPRAGHHPALSMDKLNDLKGAEPRRAQRRVPDGISPIVAWRAWGLTTDGQGWLLCGLGLSAPWQPRKTMTAQCKKSAAVLWSMFGDSPEKHPAPHKDCDCGVWAFRSLEELLSALREYKDVKVVGQVYLWGRILECENGFRAQYAYPKELWLLDDSLEELGWIYNVPIRTAGDKK